MDPRKTSPLAPAAKPSSALTRGVDPHAVRHVLESVGIGVAAGAMLAVAVERFVGSRRRHGGLHRRGSLTVLGAVTHTTSTLL